MAYIRGANTVLDGLVLALDAANPKSFRGEPTTNLIINGDFTNGKTAWGFVGDGNSYTTTGIYNGKSSIFCNGLQYYNETGYILASATMVIGTTYTVSFEYYLISGGIQFDPDGAYGGGEVTLTTTGSWIKYSATFVASTYTWINLNFYGQSGVPAYYYLTNVQLEQKDHATTFVNGSRGTTVASGGGFKDLSGCASHGEIISLPIYNSGNCGSLIYDGVDDYVNIPSFWYKPINAITCEAWIYPTKASVSGSIRGGAISCTNSMYLGIIDSSDGGNGFSLHWANQTLNSRVVSWNGSIPNNKWTHIVGTYDGSTSRAYINCVEVWSAAQIGTVSDGTYVIGTYGGALQDGFHNFNGKLPISRIYNRALSVPEIIQNYNALKSRFNIE